MFEVHIDEVAMQIKKPDNNIHLYVPIIGTINSRSILRPHHDSGLLIPYTFVLGPSYFMSQPQDT